MKNLSCVNLFTLTILGSSASGALCLSLLDASIKSSLLLAFATVASLVMVRASAATRHMVWATTMIGLLMMPACAMLLPQWRVLPSWLSLESRFEPQSPNSEPIAFNAPAIDTPIESRPSTSSNHALTETQQLQLASEARAAIEPDAGPTSLRLNASLLLGGWSTGCSLCLLPVVFAFLRLQHTERAHRKNPPLSKKIVRRVEAVASELGVRSPMIIVGPVGAMPMVWSFGRSRMLLPADIEHWPATRVKSVLLHELVHLKRHDPSWFLVGLIARAINWFNPLAWVAVHRLRLECERACDDHVLRMGVDASEYASHLLALSTSIRAASGTGSMALAMANKPNVENRILSILDEGMNRCGVTLWRAIAMLVTVSASVAVMATLAATGADKTTVNDQNEEVHIRYPHCLVEVDNLKPRSLADAILAFNKEAQESPTGWFQRPITEPETLDSIAEYLKLEHVPEPTKATLREIEATKTLPANVYFRRFTRFDDEQQMQGVWWVRLVVVEATPPVYSVPIRSTSLFARPYTQLERKQNTEGLTLINRFSSFFEEPPITRLKEEFPEDLKERLTIKFMKGQTANDLSALKELFHWQGATDSTREFVVSELEMLLKARVVSIKIEPRTLIANLKHWSAYQYYEPNLPVVAYLNIEYRDREPLKLADYTDKSGRQVFSFTMGLERDDEYLLDQGDILGVYVERVLPSKSAPDRPDRVSSELDPSIGFPIVVQKNGTIALPLIGPIAVQGKSVTQVKELIKKSYWEAGIFKLDDKLNPVVTILKKRKPYPTKTLSLELGKLGNEFRLVNYVTQGERKFPEGPVDGLSIRGNMEKLADGTYLQTEVITNPGSLISGHLANEEIRQRDIENTRKKVEETPLASGPTSGKSVSFALIGKMRLDGDAKDDRDKVKEMIESAGGLIALDLPPSGKIMGELNADTRWLVIGEGVAEIEGAEAVLSKAKELGILQIRLDKLLAYLRKSGNESTKEQTKEKLQGTPDPRFQR